MRNIIVSGLVLLSVLTGCSGRQEQYRIGVSQCLDDAWRQKMNEEMERELLLYPEMTLSTRIAHGSNELQCAQIDSFIKENVDLLIVSPNEAAQVRPAVTRAYRAGIPVIVADRRVEGDEWTAFIGGDNYCVGLLMAEWVASIQAQSKQPVHVLEVSGSLGSTPATFRHRGMIDGLAEKNGPSPHISSVMGSWMEDDAYAVVRDFLADHDDVRVIVAQNDLMAIGAAGAVRDAEGYGAGSVRIMGVDGIYDGLEAIVNGVIECTATYSSRGDMIIETAAQILAGEPFVRDTVLPTTMIDASAAQPLLMQYKEWRHDLETFQAVQSKFDDRWAQNSFDRTLNVIAFSVICVLFFLALGYIFFVQHKLQKEINQEVLPQLEDVQEAIQLSRRDEAFAERMKIVVEEHLTDPDLNVEFLASKLMLSRTQIFRRVKTVTGKGPLDYIREQRLIRAKQLLETTDMTIQQVAMELCFSSAGYFTKCYKDYFGHVPSKR